MLEISSYGGACGTRISIRKMGYSNGTCIYVDSPINGYVENDVQPNAMIFGNVECINTMLNVFPEWETGKQIPNGS